MTDALASNDLVTTGLISKAATCTACQQKLERLGEYLVCSQRSCKLWTIPQEGPGVVPPSNSS